MLATAGTVRSAMRVKSGSVAPAAAPAGAPTGRAGVAACLRLAAVVGQAGEDAACHEAQPGEQQRDQGESPHDCLRE